MKRLLILLALLGLVACTGTQGEHDPVALVVATKSGTTAQLQLIETQSLSMGGVGLVLHDDFTHTYGPGENIVQLLSPDTQRRELWVLYTNSLGDMFIDIFTMSEVSLAQPAPLQPVRKIPLGAGTPAGFDVHGNEIAVMANDDLLVYDAVTEELIATLVTIAPFQLAPVYVGSRLHYWSENPGGDVELVAATGSQDYIAFGPKVATPPVVARDVFEPDRIMHLGASGEVTIFDRAFGEDPVRVKLDDLQGPQAAYLYGGRLLSVGNTLQQVSITSSGDELIGKLVGRDSLNGAIVVPDPYNQYAYALRAGSGTMITTLVDPQSEPDDEHAIRRNIQLPGLDTPMVGEAFIVQGAP